jgi:acyl-CoA synthetase (AMP-forming)/AMP-acid ligase II
MYIAELEVLAQLGKKPRRLRTGLASGSSVSQALMNRLREEMGVEKMLIAYGMTETSPVTFITGLDDSDEKRTSTVGRVIPHTAAKVVDRTGRILPRGQRGELCISGFTLQKGYWRNEEKTKEIMRPDENGVLWMHTGDEAVIDDDGYASITGRIKDLIIRGNLHHPFGSSSILTTLTRRGKYLSPRNRGETDDPSRHQRGQCGGNQERMV